MRAWKIVFLLFVSVVFVGFVSASATYNQPDDGADIPYGTNITHEFTIEGDDGTIELYIDGSFVESWSHPTGGQTKSYQYYKEYDSSQTGTHTWDIVYYGSDGGTWDEDPPQRSYNIQTDAEATTLSSSNPNDNELVSSNDITYEYSVEEFSNYEGTVKLISDTCSQSAATLSSDTTLTDQTNSYSHTESLDCFGDFDYYPFYEGADGSTKSGTLKTFTIEKDSNQLTEFSNAAPSDNAEFNGDINQESDVTFDVDIGVPSDGGSVEFYIDGVKYDTVTPSCTSCTTTVSTTQTLSDGYYDWYAKYVGDDGSTTTTSTDSFEILDYADRASLSQSNPSDGASLTSNDVGFDYSISGGGEGDVYLVSDTCSQSGATLNSDAFAGSSTQSFSYSNTFDCSGTFDWYVEYQGDDGSSTSTSSDSFTIESDSSLTSLSLNNPSDGASLSSNDVSFGYDVNGESGNLYLYSDTCSQSGALINSRSYTGGGTSFSFTESFGCNGTFDWYVEYQGDDGTNKSTSSRKFTIDTTTDAEDTSLVRNFPKDGQVYDAENVEYNFSVDGKSGTVEIYRNGSVIDTQSYGGSGSSSFDFTETLSNGAYEYYLKYLGDDGSSKTTSTRNFEVDSPLSSSISLDVPEDNSDYSGFFPFDVKYGFNVSGEDGVVKIYQNNSNIKSFTHSSGQDISYSYNESFSNEGVREYYVEYVRDSDGQSVSSVTRKFEVFEQESVNLSVENPSQGDKFDRDASIDFSYSVVSNSAGSADFLLNSSSQDSKSVSKDSDNVFGFSSELSGGYYNSRVRFVSDDGNTHFSDYVNFSVKKAPVDYIERAEYRYRDVGGSLEESIRLNLTGNSSISGNDPVSGDTLTFNSEEWIVENISVPYSDDFVVKDSEGRNETLSLDLDVSVKSLRGHNQDNNLSYQEKNKTLVVDNSGDSFDFNYSCSDNVVGDISMISDVVDIGSDSSRAFGCFWSGDWIDHSSGIVKPSVSSVDIDEDLGVQRLVNMSNNQSLTFSNVSASEELPDNTCVQDERFEIASNQVINKTINFSCDIGDSGSPQTNIDGSDYNHTTVLNVSSDLAENISISWSEEKSNIEDWGSKDDGSAVAYVKGTSDSILLVESSDSVTVTVPDDAFSSSLHEGQTQASIAYTVGSSSSSPSAGGGGSSDAIIVTKNVTGEYNWSVSAPRSRGQKFFNIVGWGGRDLGNAPTRVVARNLGDNNFSVSAECVSNDGSCEFIELSKKNISLDTLGNRENVVEVEGVVPEEIPDDGYRFNIVFEDPEGKEIETNFRINKNFAQSLIIRFISKLTGVEEYDLDGDGGGDPIPVPLFLPMFILTLVFWGVMALAVRFAQSNNMIESGMDFVRGRLILTVLFFILAFIFI